MRTHLGRTSLRNTIAPGALAVLLGGPLLGACATGGDEVTSALSVDTPTSTSATATAPSTTTAPSPSTTTATAPSTTTATAPSTAPTPSTAPATSPSPLIVLAIGDSFVAWSSWPELYATEVETALGRPTELDTSLARAGAGPRLDAIRDDERAHARIRAADIVIVQPQPGFAAAPPMRAYLGETCGGEANTACFDTAADEYRTYIAEYLDLITSLTTDGTAIRIITTGTWVMDALHPRLREEDPASLHDLIDLVDELMAVVESEAQARSIPVVDVNTAFNGLDHREPAPDDYLVADRMHLDDAGSAVVARLLTETGYSPLEGDSG